VPPSTYAPLFSHLPATLSARGRVKVRHSKAKTPAGGRRTTSWVIFSRTAQLRPARSPTRTHIEELSAAVALWPDTRKALALGLPFKAGVKHRCNAHMTRAATLLPNFKRASLRRA